VLGFFSFLSSNKLTIRPLWVPDIIATTRKLAVLLHRLWVSGEVYEPLRNRNQGAMPAAA
jgi:hypothetical protein